VEGSDLSESDSDKDDSDKDDEDEEDCESEVEKVRLFCQSVPDFGFAKLTAILVNTKVNRLGLCPYLYVTDHVYNIWIGFLPICLFILN
jgi:hypothetical protein